jgi:subtilisin-like proprotein convertase family protein
MLSKKNWLVVVVLCSINAVAQTYTNTIGGTIADNNTYTSYPISVSGLNPANLNTSSFGLESVTINIAHTAVGDLRIKLESPDGSEYVLTSFLGGTGNDYTNTNFTDTAANSISAGTVPFTGYFKPIDALSNFNNGQNGNGTWNLNIRDQTTGNTGSVTSWSIKFSNTPAGFVNFTSSNLPIIIINTNNQAIVDDPKIYCNMGIIYNGVGNRNYITDPLNHYNGRIGIELRGSSSQWFDKKPYGFETVDNNNLELDTALLGMPSEHDWILSASYSDKTFLHNPLSYKLANDMNRYAPRTQFVELVVNGDYKGVYTLMEKIKRDDGRVDIAKLDLDDNAGDSLTGGYIIKVDKTTGSGGAGWYSNYAPAVSTGGQQIYFQYDYPSDVNITPQQINYIQQYIDSFETALNGPNFADTAIGYKKYLSTYSFIDYFLINELSRNVDGYRISTYLHKEKNGKIKMGPVWDYDIAWHNADYCNGSLTTGWAHEFGNDCPADSWQVPFWWRRLLQDTNYANKLRCQWDYLKTNILSLSAINQYIDTNAALLNESQQRNFTRWPILGVYVWPNPSPIPTSYQGEITQLKQWITQRWNWLDANIPGNCYTLSTPETILPQNSVSVFPNPFNANFTVEFYMLQNSAVQFALYNMLGEKIYTSTNRNYNAGGNQFLVNTASLNLNSGMYLLKITCGNTVITKPLVKTN